MKLPKIRDFSPLSSSRYPLSVKLVKIRNLCLQIVSVFLIIYFVMPGQDWRGEKFLRAIVATNFAMLVFEVFSDKDK